MRTYMYVLFLLTNFYNNIQELASATEINAQTMINNFNQHSHSVDQTAYQNTIHNLMYQRQSQSVLESPDGVIHEYDRPSQRNEDPNPSAISQKHNKINISNEQKSATSNDKPTQYIGLSLIKGTDHNKTINFQGNTAEDSTELFNSDTTIFSENMLMNRFTKEERDCFDDEHVYHNRLCQELFKRGSCGEGEWLLLDINSALKAEPRIVPKCKQKICKDNEVYWNKTQHCYKLSDETDKELCLPGNTVERDYFSGFGICKCKRQSTIHGLFNNGTCFPLYTQGPCLKNYIFVENNHITECIRNPCKNSSLVRWEDGDKKCYELNSEGPCDKSHRFMISSKTLKPTCLKDVQLLSIISPPEFCVTNGNRVCEPEFKVDQGAEYVKNILIAAIKKKAKATKQ